MIANGGTPSAETFTLDASGWRAIASGYRYQGPTGTDGDPVQTLTARRTPAGVALVKVVLRGKLGTQPLDVVPPNPGADGGLVLDVAGGDRYCIVLGGAAGGIEQKNTVQRWKVKDAPAEPGCPTTSTTTITTTTSTVTTTTGLTTCGNNVIDPGEECDGTALPPFCVTNGLQCEAPGFPGECHCCASGFCSLSFNIPCCGDGVYVTCFDDPGPQDSCVSCTVGSVCGVLSPFPTSITPCCGGAQCLKVGLAPNQVFCCMPNGGTCTGDADCCGSFCDPGTSTCQCAPSGHACMLNSDCCSAACSSGTCS